MIERLLTRDESIKRWRRFKKRPVVIVSVWALMIVAFFSFTAEFWANSKPIVLHWKGETYWPIIKDYPASNFGQEHVVIPDFKKLEISGDNWVIWPLVKWDPYESNTEVEEYPAPPSASNWMGTDDRGRDIFTRLLYGYRYSMTFAVLVWIITFAVGTVLGGIMGYFGGRVDFWGQRIVEVLSTVPQFFLLIIIISIFKPTLFLLILISCLFGWISISYYVRGEFLKNRKKEFVEGARAIGGGHFRVFFLHLLPNSLSPLITFSPFAIAGNITALASLDYLGFGLTPPTPSWGELLNQAQRYFTLGWWLAVYPSLVLFLTLTALALIGEAVRDAMDPKA